MSQLNFKGNRNKTPSSYYYSKILLQKKKNYFVQHQTTGNNVEEMQDKEPWNFSFLEQIRRQRRCEFVSRFDFRPLRETDLILSSSSFLTFLPPLLFFRARAKQRLLNFEHARNLILHEAPRTRWPSLAKKLENLLRVSFR